MSDEKLKTRPVNNVRINMNSEEEIKYWMEKFNCSREELQKAVNAVGTSIENLQKFLR